MIKKTIILGLLCYSSLTNILAQVGINTQSPTSTLDVNGNIQVAKNILIGGNDTTLGSVGIAGEFIVSQGEGKAPKWEEVVFPPEDMGDWYLLGSISRIDTTGLKFNGNEYTGTMPYIKEGTLYSSPAVSDTEWSSVQHPAVVTRPWRQFKDFTIDLGPREDTLRVVVNLQVLVNATWPTSSSTNLWMSYAIGVFREDMNYRDQQNTPTDQKKWKINYLGSRQGGCIGSGTANSPQELATMVLTLDLPPQINGTKVQPVRLLFMGTQRNNSLDNAANSQITIGRDFDNNGGLKKPPLSKQATMRVDVYQKVRKRNK